MASEVAFDKLGLCVQILCTCHLISPDRLCNTDTCLFQTSLKLILIFSEAHLATARPVSNKHRCWSSLSYGLYSQKYILNCALDIFGHSVYSEVQPQEIPASHIASLTSGNECLVGPGWWGDSDGWQRISHLLPEREGDFLTVHAISVSTGNFSPTVKRRNQKFIIYMYQVLTLIVLMWRIGWAHNNARK